MPLFSIEGSKLREVRETPFSKESKLQDLTEENLQVVFGLKFVSSGFKSRNLIVDSLAFNPESKSFVIIEYKKDKNFTVIDQGFAYLQLLLNNKADSVLEYNFKMDAKLKKENIDWSQSRVLFVAPSYTEHQRKAINFKDLPMELWEVRKYDNSTVLYEQILPTVAEESIATIAGKSSLVKKVIEEVQVYTEEYPLRTASPATAPLYMALRETILLNLGNDIIIKPTKLYLSYKRNSNFADVEIQKSKLKITINVPSGKLEDPLKIAENVKGKGHWGVGDYQITISNESDIGKALPLIKQSYDSN